MADPTGALTYFDTKTGKDVYAPSDQEYIPGTQTLRPRGSGNGGAAGTPPNSSADLAQYDALGNSLGSNVAEQGKINAPVNDALSKYMAYLNGQPSLQDVSTQFENAAGLPAARKTASSLQDQVNNLDDTISGVKNVVAGTTRDSMVTQAQRDAMITARQAPLQDNLTKLTTNLARIKSSITDAENLVAQKLALYGQDQTAKAQPYIVQLQTLQAQAAAMTTAFTADQKNTLDVALAKIQRGEALSDLERTEAFTALQNEQSYQNELAKIKAQSDANLANNLKQIKAQSAANVSEKKVQSGLNIAEATKQQQLDIQKSKLEWHAPTAGGTISGGVLTPPATTISAPNTNQSIPVGTMQEDPNNPGMFYRWNGTAWE